MHMLGLLGILVGALALLAFGLFWVWRELLQITHDAPLVVEDDGLAWSSRYRGAAPTERGVKAEGQLAGRP